MFYNILDKERLDILPLFKELKNKFYLAGGTALALQIGHRDSVDFDFFSEENIDTGELFEKLEDIFVGYKIQKVQEEKNTLTIVIGKNVKVSFFAYKYMLLNDFVKESYLRLASVEDIACMKLSAIVSRSTEKDYIDLYFILQNKSLAELMKLLSKKFSALDKNLVIKSLVYFDDIEEEAIMFKNDKNVLLDDVKKFLIKEVEAYYNGNEVK